MNGGVSVRANGLGRRFTSRSGQDIVALYALHLELPEGALVVVRGPSGCGKSTLLNLIGLLDRPTTGSLEVMGAETAHLSPEAAAVFRRRHVGFLFQDGGLIEPMSVARNIALPLVYREVPTIERPARIRAALEGVGLLDRWSSGVSELSGGERQRVALARALVSDPALLICDEPTAALDEANSIAITDLLAVRAGQNRTVICSSHDPIVIARADILVELRHGRISSEGRA